MRLMSEGVPLVATRSPLADVVYTLWESGRLPNFSRLLLAHRRETNPTLGRCQHYARAFALDAMRAGLRGVTVHEGDVGLIDTHWWVEWQGEALDVPYLEGHGFCVSVMPVAEFKASRRVREGRPGPGSSHDVRA